MMYDAGMVSQEDTDALESLIDRYTLRAVLDALHGICYGKAEHLRANWQDQGAAKAWERAGRKLEPSIRNAAEDEI